MYHSQRTLRLNSKMAPGPSPLSASFSDSEGDHPQRQKREDLSPELIKSLKQACRNLERRMIEEEEKRMWAAVTVGKSIKATKRWKGRSPAGSGSSENRRKN
ncbi:uncharacterized protein EAE98_002970 [Botrytis deweyae]|uniref:Uncharacterized protein n=1 Tax=Botrytis deweyae TaxID=2478750 RepID=A0ABQ7IV82_9HELO|nr:uncharacterized protein EAE98_002970 [Botrytis deweyae]KAF7934925.1 hypothetical protein EAE98_002970 [Botrytis deweyae]